MNDYSTQIKSNYYELYGRYSTQIQSIYVAYYGRGADPTGLAYWQTKLQDSDGDLTQIIEAFTSSDEAKANFDVLSDSEMIDAIYLQTLNREPELEGKAYYLERMANGSSTHGSIALDILNGAQYEDLKTIQNKIFFAEGYSDYFYNHNPDVWGFRDESPPMSSYMSEINASTVFHSGYWICTTDYPSSSCSVVFFD